MLDCRHVTNKSSEVVPPEDMSNVRDDFLDAYGSTGAPDFRPYFEFVELVHLAAYTKLMFIEQKWTNVDAQRFERFV